MRRNPIPLIAVIMLYSLEGIAQGSHGFELMLRSGTITPGRNITEQYVEDFNRQSARTAGKTFAVIQFEKLINEEEKAQLAAAGIDLLDYIPNFAYTAMISGNISRDILLQFDARSLLQLTASQKMEPGLSRGDFPAWSVNAIGTVDTWVSFPSAFSSVEVISELKRSGFAVISTDKSKYRILAVRTPVSRLGELALLPFIDYVQPLPPPEQPLNFTSISLSRANVLRAPLAMGGKNLDGSGVVIGFGENGDAQSHLDFTGKLINRAGAGNQGHASHVAGTIGGRGLINELYEGYATQSTLVGQIFSRIITNAAVYVQDHDMVVTNNSYGLVVNDCSYNGLYDLTARSMDQLAIDLPWLTHVFSAGNDGLLTCSPYATGFHTVLGAYQSSKNTITVAASSEKGVISGFSSRGPVKDGRLKPEITAQGHLLPSTWVFNQYSYNSGTSMSAPGISGGLALLIELYRNENAGADPKAGLMKALLCNGAYDGGNTGPDFKYGFGNMNLLRSSQMIEDATHFTDAVIQGQTKTHTVSVPANTAQLKVLLYWVDPPAAILSSKTLVNDLDLQVIAPGPTTNYPFILDTAAANLNNNASTGADHFNNIEQVVINNPAPGNYNLNVSGTLIAQNPSQEYFLVYDNIPAGLILTNPIGGERMIESIIVVTGLGLDSVYIQWDSYGAAESGFSLEFYNGTAWAPLNGGTPINGSLRGYNWGVPQNLATDNAMIRITGNSSLIQKTSLPFVITPTPTVSLSATQCEGYIQIQWPAISGVTDYEVMMLQGNDMVSVATTTQLTYTFNGLDKDSVYWVTMRPRINGNPGRRANAVSRQPNSGSCAGTISDNDLRLENITAPTGSGRENTSRVLANNELITLRIRNLDDNISTDPVSVSYTINGGAPVLEVISPTIAAGGFHDHTFATPANLSVAGSYEIVVAATKASDPVTANNSYTKTFRQLTNAPITNLDLPWLDNLESMPMMTLNQDTMGLSGRDRYDFINSTAYGRIRSFINSGIAYSGSRALTLDISQFQSAGNVDSLTGTFNLGSFTTTDDIRVDFRYKNHGQLSNAANRVWIRGSDLNDWIEIFDLYANQPGTDGSYKLMSSVEINDSLSAHGQTYTSSFQMRIGQWGRYMAADNESGAGYSFDDFRIYRAIDDIQLLRIDTPVVIACGLNTVVPVKAVVRNTSASTISNIPIVLRVDGVIVANETIPSIPGNDTVHYTFSPGTANLQAFTDHLVEVWVDYITDNVPDNDTASVIAKNLPRVTTFPYLENFDSGAGSWYTKDGVRGTWQYGTPASAKINRAASGTKAWKTNIYGYYNDLESSYLYSPCFDVTGMTNPTLSFSLALDIEDGDSVFYDGAWMEYSTDGGQSWSHLGAMGDGTNWYNRNYSGLHVWSQENYQRWHVATVPLPSSANLRLRFVFNSDGGVTKDGIAVDDIHIYDNLYGIYTGSGESPVSTQPTVNGSSWIDFKVSNQLIASINPGGQDLGSTDVQSFVHTGPVRINRSQYYHNRNITMKPANVALADSAIVRFYFLDTETEALISATGCAGCYKPAMAYELGVTKYSDPVDANENGTLSDNLMGNYLFINAARAVKVPFDKGYYAEFRVKDFSEFWLNNGGLDNNTPLPVNLLSFTATKTGADVLLKWITATETNVDKYEIELAKGNDAFQLNAFSRIGEVRAAGNSISQQQYSFIDRELFKSGARYYRLRMVDQDGSFKYSPVRPVIFENDIKWQVYPNPSTGRFTVTCQLNPGELVTFRLYDAEGKIVKQEERRGSGFPEKYELDISQPAFPRGVYLLEALNEGRKQVFRLVKQ